MGSTAFQAFKNLLESPEVQYTALIFALFVIPRFFIRLGFPLALTAFLLGLGGRIAGLEAHGDKTVELLSSLGITSLFLFAGMEVRASVLRENRGILVQHVAIRIALLGVLTFLGARFLSLDFRPAALLSLAVLTPSTGFILDSIDTAPVPDSSKFWIRSKAIAGEIVALVAMFVLVRTMSWTEFGISVLGLAALIFILPGVFRFFSLRIAPVAPKSEFGFLLMMAILSGLVTKKLGAYYLIGAFVVGLAARRFEDTMPGLTSKTMLRSLKLFVGFFTPFYFFHAGAELDPSFFSMSGLGLGLLLLISVLPLRIYGVVLHRRLSLKETPAESLPIACSLLPNLVFGLVIVELLRSVFAPPPYVIGGAIVYTVGATLLAPFLLRHLWEARGYAAIAEAEGDFSSLNDGKGVD